MSGTSGKFSLTNIIEGDTVPVKPEMEALPYVQVLESGPFTGDHGSASKTGYHIIVNAFGEAPRTELLHIVRSRCIRIPTLRSL